MRITHRNAVSAMLARHACKPGKNDMITIGNNGVLCYIWRYHGNNIAYIDSAGKVFVNWQGWYTQSTAGRLYTLCFMLNVPRPEKKSGWLQVR